jgi:hypothetical protein
MAFTASPETQTYSTQIIPAAYDLDLRPDSALVRGTSSLYQDAGMVNLLPVKYNNYVSKAEEIHAVTRQPIHAYAVVAGQVNRGSYAWEKTAGTTYYFSVCGTGVYTSTDGITWSLVNTLLTSATTPVRFTEFINDVNVKTLIMVDGIEGYVFSDNTAGTKITDAEFPTPHVPFPVYLDGYLFLAKAGTGDIYNSDLLDPTAWTAGAFISSELYPDDIQALVKVNNYLLAVGTQGCEFFYDAGTAPGTPLARSEGVSLPFGTQFPNSIASNKDTVMMIANNNDGENTVKYIQDFKSENVNPSFLITALNARLEASSNAATAAGVRGFFFRQAGLLHYGLAFQGDVASPALANSTYVYSFDAKYWSEFRAGATGAAPFPVYFTASSTTGTISTFVSGHVDGYAFFGKMEDGAASPFSATATDVVTNGATNAAIYTELRTPNLDCGTQNVKTMSRLGLTVTENTSSSSTSGTPLQIGVSWSDDDYSTWSSVRNLVFAAANKFPFLTQLGLFRQRAFKFTYASTSFLRYKQITFDINKGQQ